MSKTIFYFSGTGNSLKTAKEIKTKIEANELISMSQGLEEYNSCQSQVIGFVFPVYFGGIPNRVFQFINNLYVNPPKLYICCINIWPVSWQWATCCSEYS
ncbi:flavodoxin domain-containing protein [endosymbiont 'TC1' of Trimyema compressum]|uniref:flavodoxin domain-containing protein n=1 Tax=endosymbiont 'TC1' of Trimyema compressum TaxID=243899 RepID=UPI000A7C98EC|nr:flavodoxin domain-containing protein [endosymbiont 'TC1' of Trimyema compressum]